MENQSNPNSNTVSADSLHHYTELEMSQIPHKSPLNKKKMALILGGIVLLFAVGVPLLLRLAVSINSPKNPQSNIVTQSPAPLINLASEFLSDQVATSEAKFELVIKPNTKETVNISQNGEQILQILPVDGQNITQIVSLKEGENIFTATYHEPFSNTDKISQEFKIVLKKSKPSLNITSPNDNEGVSGDEVLVAGSTEKDNSVSVNNLPATIDQNGNFQIKIRLKNGTNTIRVVVTDFAKNTTEEEFNIEYSGN